MGHPGLLIGPGQIPDVVDHRADADDHLDPQLLVTAVAICLAMLLKLLDVRAIGQLLDEGHIGLIDGDDKVHLLVREEVLNHVDGTHIGGAQLPHQEGGPGAPSERKCSSLGLGIDVPQQDVVRNDILYKGSLIVLLFIIGLASLKATTAIEHRAAAVSSSP